MYHHRRAFGRLCCRIHRIDARCHGRQQGIMTDSPEASPLETPPPETPPVEPPSGPVPDDPFLSGAYRRILRTTVALSAMAIFAAAIISSPVSFGVAAGAFI